MRHIPSIFLKSLYLVTLRPKKFYSQYAKSATFHDSLLFAGLSSILAAFSTGLWFTYTGSLFGFGSAGGLKELAAATAAGAPSVFIMLFVTAYLTMLGLRTIGVKSDWRQSFAAYAFSLPVFFLLLQIPVVNIFMPFYLIYVQIRGISELVGTPLIQAAMGWSIQALVQSMILLIPLTYYSLQAIP